MAKKQTRIVRVDPEFQKLKKETEKAFGDIELSNRKFTKVVTAFARANDFPNVMKVRVIKKRKRRKGEVIFRL